MSFLRTLAVCLPLSTFALLAQAQDPSGSSAAATGQTQPKDAASSSPAPPDIEQALRARVSEYYQDCVDHKYREAEKVLAEESRDYFYNHDKPHYKGFDIQKIDWSENFTKATVSVKVTVDMRLGSVVIPGYPVNQGDWRIVDGQWYLHLITPQEGYVMPWGTVVQIPEPQANDSSTAPKVDMSRFSREKIREQAAAILTGVKADHTDVVFDSVKPGEAVVHITNGTPSIAALKVNSPKLTGLSVSIDKTRLASTEQAQLTLRWKPTDHMAKPLTIVHVTVAPTGEDIPIQIRFSFSPAQPGSSAALSRP